MSRSTDNPWLHRFAVFTAAATLALIGIGGLVTSKEAGMSVPDWPTSYGYHMFLLPFKFWKGGALHEHSHRLIAIAVGLLTAILAIWLWIKETSGKIRRNGILVIIGVLLVVGGMMGVRNNPVFLSIALASLCGIIIGIFKIKQTSGLRWFGIVALSAVVLQGILGGLRVVLFKDELGIFHATLAQLFLVLISAIALFTSDRWQRMNSEQTNLPSRSLRWLASATTILIFVQLILGATMRHQHAGLAIPDFPLAYGKIWPPTDSASIQTFNQMRHDVLDPNSITAFQIVIHMVHRITAFLILFSIVFLAFKFRKELGAKSKLARLSMIWLGMILAQLGLGILTVLKNKPADIATAHVVLGASSLVMGTIIALIARKISVEAEKTMRHVIAASSVKPASGSKAALTTT